MFRIVAISLISFALTGVFAMADSKTTATNKAATATKTETKTTAPAAKTETKAAPAAAKTESKTTAAPATTKTETKAETKTTEAAKSGELLDINTASLKELIALPGIGEVKAKQIVAGRPYKNKTQLKTNGKLSDKDYEKIADLVIAKQPK